MDTISGSGGAADEYDMDITVGSFDGKWLAFSLVGNTIPPGYYRFTTLVVDSLSANGCDPDSFVLDGGVISDIMVRLAFVQQCQFWRMDSNKIMLCRMTTGSSADILRNS